MKHFYFATIVLLLLIPHALPVLALDNGPVDSALTAHSLSINVELILWGFADSLSPETHIVQQAYRHGQLEQYYSYMYDRFWAWDYSISYTINYMNQSQVEYFQTYAINSSTVTTGIYNNNSIFGRNIPSSSMNSFFADANHYSINIVNLTSIDAFNGSHWFSNTPDLSAYNFNSDFRNFVELSSTTYLYDPTAYTPYTSQIQAAVNSTDFLNIQISTIVEQIVLGSPYSSAFSLPSVDEFAHHFAYVVLYNSSNGEIGSLASFYRDMLTFKSQINYLTSFLKYRQFSELVIDVATNPKLRTLIASSTVYNGSQPYIVVDQSFSDNLKNIIRSNTSFYSKWPVGFYHMVNIMAFDTQTEFLTEQNSSLVPYDNSILGMSVVPAKDWYVARSQQNSPSLVARALHAWGESVGLPTYNKGTSQFVPSVMSPYEGTGDFVAHFSQTDKIIFARKFAMFYNVSFMSRYTIYTSSFQSAGYDWIVSLAPVEQTLPLYRHALSLYSANNVTGATRELMDAYSALGDAIIKVNQNIRAVSYGTLSFVILVGLYTLYLYIVDFAKPAPEEARTQKNLPISWLRPKND